MFFIYYKEFFSTGQCESSFFPMCESSFFFISLSLSFLFYLRGGLSLFVLLFRNFLPSPLISKVASLIEWMLLTLYLKHIEREVSCCLRNLRFDSFFSFSFFFSISPEHFFNRLKCNSASLVKKNQNGPR